MECLADQGYWLMCHLVRIVPAAGMYASTSMLNVHLQGAGGGFHIIAGLIFFVSAALLVLTSHKALAGVKPGRIAAALAILSVVRLLNEPRTLQKTWTLFLRIFLAEYLRNASLVAIALAVGFPAPPRIAVDQDPEEYASQRSQDSASRILSENYARITDWLSDASMYIKHMGPSSRVSSRSSRASDISLNSDSARRDAVKEQWIQSQGQIVMGISQDHNLPAISPDLPDLA